jgi:alpha-tubulin suppressor-like RCC1 family protein
MNQRTLLYSLTVALLAGVGLSACDVEILAFPAAGLMSVTIGEAHSCALSEYGAAYCWGDGTSGQLGTGMMESSRFPVLASGIATFVVLDAGGRHTCGLTADGRAYCWGANDSGQLGIGNRERALEPMLVKTTERLVSLSAGWDHTCAINAEGRAFCWGQGTHGESGGNNLDPAITSPAPAMTDVRFSEISAGGRHTCGIAVSGSAYCWGANEVAQLGIGEDSEPHSVPKRVDANIVFSGISAGWNHTCGVTPQRLAYCWGENAFGEIGNDSWAGLGIPAHLVPDEVNGYGEIQFVQISAGKHYTCGLGERGHAYCWGNNAYGQLGIGSLLHRFNPQWVRPGPGREAILRADVFVKIDAGGDNHVCGSSSDGALFCWGDGGAGQIGSGERLSMIALPVVQLR